MPRSRLFQPFRLLSRSVRSSNVTRSVFRSTSAAFPTVARPTVPLHCAFSACAAKQAPVQSSVAPTPTDLTDGQYHELADTWLENALARFEELQDQSDELDVEYSSGVMTIRVPEKGTYVLNKQPPNKQIWLSSPVSGPKRYDWCIVGDGQGDKEATAAGRWVYARDNTTLDQLILEELNIDLQEPVDG